MNKRLWTAAAITGLLALAACKQEGISVSNNQTQGQTDEALVENMGVANMSDAEVSVRQQNFVQAAAASDLFEIESSRLAMERASLPSAKSYAETMVEEHGKALEELRVAAQAAGIAVPTALPANMQAEVEALRGLSGSAFDQRYLAAQRAGHQQTLATVNDYLATAEAGPLRDHAAKLTGVVQKHLNGLEKIR